MFPPPHRPGELARLTCGSLRKAATHRQVSEGWVGRAPRDGAVRGQCGSFRAPFVMRSWVLWRPGLPPAHSWQVPSGLGVGGGARGSLLSGAPPPPRLRTLPLGLPSFLPSESEGAARLLGRKARPLSSPCPPCPREVGTREAHGPRGPFPSISSEAGGFWGSCRGVRGRGVPAHHDGVVRNQRHPHSAGVGLGCLSAPGGSRGSDPNP